MRKVEVSSFNRSFKRIYDQQMWELLFKMFKFNYWIFQKEWNFHGRCFVVIFVFVRFQNNVKLFIFIKINKNIIHFDDLKEKKVTGKRLYLFRIKQVAWTMFIAYDFNATTCWCNSDKFSTIQNRPFEMRIFLYTFIAIIQTQYRKKNNNKTTTREVRFKNSIVTPKWIALMVILIKLLISLYGFQLDFK